MSDKASFDALLLTAGGFRWWGLLSLTPAQRWCCLLSILSDGWHIWPGLLVRDLCSCLLYSEMQKSGDAACCSIRLVIPSQIAGLDYSVRWCGGGLLRPWAEVSWVSGTGDV